MVLSKLNKLLGGSVLRWIITVVGSTAVGAWITQILTPEIIAQLQENVVAVLGGLAAIIAIVQSIISKIKTARNSD